MVCVHCLGEGCELCEGEGVTDDVYEMLSVSQKLRAMETRFPVRGGHAGLRQLDAKKKLSLP